jgi:predicted O-methyltransferase YrrM
MEVFDWNMAQAGATEKVTRIKGLSGNVIRAWEPEIFDFIYIDGSHNAADVLEDAVLSWRLLKPGGILTFDDYEWRWYSDPKYQPKMAIDAWMQIHEDKYDLVRKEYQVTVRKKPYWR